MQPAHHYSKGIYLLLVAVPALLLASAARNAPGEDWAPIMPRATQSLLLDVTLAGDRLVTVGDRGHILYSDDEGANWAQARVPMRQMLTSVFFVNPASGWAAGHDGAILHTEDAGTNWSLQRDGLKDQALINAGKLAAARQQVARLQATLGTGADQETAIDELEQAQMELEDAQWLQSQPVFAPPLMDLWFEDARHGWAVGAFGTILRTGDGGAHWQDASSGIDNPDDLHYNAITGDGNGRLLIAGESGGLYRSLDRGNSWRQLSSPYEGSWFGTLYLPQSGRIVVFGLEGKVFYSDDFGDNWQPAQLPAETSFAGGYSDGERVVLVGGVGTVVWSADGGQDFALVAQRLPGSLSAIARARQGSYVAVGMGGIYRLPTLVGEVPVNE